MLDREGLRWYDSAVAESQEAEAMADAVLYHVMIPSGLRSDTHDHLTMYSSHQTEDGAVEAAEHLRRGGHPVVHVCKVELTTLRVLDSAVGQEPIGRRVKALLGR